MQALVSAENVTEAAKQAGTNGQWLLVVFSGSWCKKCPDFKKELQAHIVDNYEVACGEVDVGNEEAEQLKEEHLVTKLPTLLVVDGDGKPVARLVQPHISEVRMVAKSMFKPKAVTDGDF